jgi:hypothetical protein
MSTSRFYVTSFCNFPHRLSDGKPINHECYILPTAALVAETQGRYQTAQDILSEWKNRRRHAGVRHKNGDT